MHGEYGMSGDTLMVIGLDIHPGRSARVQLSGDFLLKSDSALLAINAALEDLPFAAVATLVLM